MGLDLHELCQRLYAEAEAGGSATDSTSSLTFEVAQGEAVLSGNRRGLIRLAAQVLELADRSPGSHQHYDAASELDGDPDVPLIIARSGTWET